MGEAGKTHASSARVRQLLGRLQFAVGDYPAAAKSFEDAVGAGVRSTELYRELGLALCAQGATAPDAAQSWVRATECLAGALQAGGEDPAEIAGYALSLVRLGQEEKGRGLYRQAAPAAARPAARAAGRGRALPAGTRGRAHAEGPRAPRDRRGGDAGRAAGARERRREHPLLGCRDRDVAARAARARRARARAGPDRRRHAPAVGRRGRCRRSSSTLETGRTLLSMQRHTGFATALAMTPDGTRAVAGRLRPRRPRVGPGDGPVPAGARGASRGRDLRRRQRGQRDRRLGQPGRHRAAVGPGGGPRGVHVRGPPRPRQRRALRGAARRRGVRRRGPRAAPVGRLGPQAAGDARGPRAGRDQPDLVRRRAAGGVGQPGPHGARLGRRARAAAQRLPRGVRRAGAGPRRSTGSCGSRRARR